MELGKRVVREGKVPGTWEDDEVWPLNPDMIERIERQYGITVDTKKGVEFKDIAYPWDTVEQMWDYALKQGGFTWKELQEAVWKMPEFKYRKYETGDLRDDGGLGFQTPSGRAEIYSLVFQYASEHTDEAHKLDPLPSYVEPRESPYSAPELAEQFPYILTTGARVPHFFHSEHRQVKKLRALHPDPLCYLHPDTAKEHGIADGEWFWIWNDHGKCYYKASYNETYHPRVMQCEHAWWFPERGPADPDVEAGPYGVFESNCNNLIPLPAGVSGFGSNYKAMVCQIGKEEPPVSNVPDKPVVK